MCRARKEGWLRTGSLADYCCLASRVGTGEPRSLQQTPVPPDRACGLDGVALSCQSGPDQDFGIHPPIHHRPDWGSRLTIVPLFFPPQGELLSPCRCDGSVKCTHQPCLIKWISERGCWSCELCYYKYHVIAISTKNPLQVNPGLPSLRLPRYLLRRRETAEPQVQGSLLMEPYSQERTKDVLFP